MVSTRVSNLGRRDVIVSGDDFELRTAVFDSDGSKVMISQVQISGIDFVIADEIDGKEIIRLTSGDYVYVDSDTDELVVLVTRDLTRNLYGSYFYELKVHSPSLGTFTPVKGRIYVHRSFVQGN